MKREAGIATKNPKGSSSSLSGSFDFLFCLLSGSSSTSSTSSVAGAS